MSAPALATHAVIRDGQVERHRRRDLAARYFYKHESLRPVARRCAKATGLDVARCMEKMRDGDAGNCRYRHRFYEVTKTGPRAHYYLARLATQRPADPGSDQAFPPRDGTADSGGIKGRRIDGGGRSEKTAPRIIGGRLIGIFWDIRSRKAKVG